MVNKCPKCGYEYNDSDVFCSKCGCKLNNDSNNFIQEDLIGLSPNVINNLQEIFIRNSSSSDVDTSAYKPKAEKLYNGTLFNFTLSLFIIVCICTLVLTVSIKKHNVKKEYLNYKNLINNPAQIPQLKEPLNFLDFKNSIFSINNFLFLYLKHSKDDIDKKEQVFLSYLIEIQKSPHLTNENLIKDENDNCSKVETLNNLKFCTDKFNSKLKDTGLKAYYGNYTIYFYPDYKYINKRYSKYLSDELKNYLELKSKYNTPANIDLYLKITPNKLAQKIYDFEKLYNSTQSYYIKDELEKEIYKDVRTFIFSPEIYATTTQEMKSEFKNAYQHFISSKKDSAIRPVIISYFEKQKNYTEENFKNDYPYNIFNDDFNTNVDNSHFGDVFATLRKKFFSNSNSKSSFAYIYNIAGGSWVKYDEKANLSQGQFVISYPDEKNNLLIYDNTLSVSQELKIPLSSSVFSYNKGLYVYNADKLAISKLQFTGQMFVVQNLNFYDISSLFPGIEIINLDSYRKYDIFIKKDNIKANYIILSKYSRGYENYKLSVLKGEITQLMLPNMFSVSSSSDTVISFHNADVEPDETSEKYPTYKFAVSTYGYEAPRQNIYASYPNNYDDDSIDDIESAHKPNIMPKIPEKQTVNDNDSEYIDAPPIHNIDPPNED